ncbi:PefC/AfrB family outer membrane usher protein [Citrobacter braakii]
MRRTQRQTGSLSTLALLLGTVLASPAGRADGELDMSFIQGGNQLSPEAWAALNSRYAPGRYLVDLTVNRKPAGRQVLEITPQDSEELCLPEAWLVRAGVYIRQAYFRDGYDAARQCYVLAGAPSTRVEFDVTTQSLALSLPQRALAAKPETVEWDYGNAAMRVNYNLNSSRGRYDTTSFGSADLKANAGRWVVSSVASGSTGKEGSTGSVAMFTASRAIRSLEADLQLGKTSVGTGLLGSTGTWGATLTHNNSMRPGNIGYSPVFSGTAAGSARVTLRQGNNTLHSEMVPPGPFAITNIPLYSSGDVTMTITEENGRVITQVFPVSVMAGQLNPGQHEYSVSAGMPDDDSDMQGGLLSASYGYGLDGLTLRAGGAFNQHYSGVTAGVVTGLGPVGALSADGARARAEFLHRPQESGEKVQLAWTKQLEVTNTGLRLSWSRTLTPDFPELSGVDPTDTSWTEAYRPRQRSIRDEWNAGISQSVGGESSLSLSGWQRSYHHDSLRDQGLTGSLSTRVRSASMTLAGSRSAGGNGSDSWSASLSVSIPFTLSEKRYSSNTTVSTSRGSGTGVTTGLSGNLSERFSASASTGRDGDGGSSSYLSGSYSGDLTYLGGNLNQSSAGGTSGSLSLSGSVLAVPAARSVMLSRTVADTVAVVSVKDTPGVKVTSGSGTTGSGGHLVVPLTSYDLNTVTIEAGSLPLDTELGNTSRQVIPVSQAVVWMPFEPLKVRRYLLQVRMPDGAFVPGGVWAKDERGAPLGFVAASGVLVMNVMDKPGRITLDACVIPGERLKETDKLQEIRCEK